MEVKFVTILTKKPVPNSDKGIQEPFPPKYLPKKSEEEVKLLPNHVITLVLTTTNI